MLKKALKDVPTMYQMCSINVYKIPDVFLLTLSAPQQLCPIVALRPRALLQQQLAYLRPSSTVILWRQCVQEDISNILFSARTEIIKLNSET
jgi:hypothetical protein